MTFHAFAGEPATHSSKCQLIIVNRIISQHRKDIVRNMVSDFKPTSVLKNFLTTDGMARKFSNVVLDALHS